LFVPVNAGADVMMALDDVVPATNKDPERQVMLIFLAGQG
jgi:hypothetical protein